MGSFSSRSSLSSEFYLSVVALDEITLEMLEALSRCSMLCHGWAGGVRGCRGLSPAARNVVGPGEMRCDDLCTSADVGTLGDGWNGLTVTGCQRLWWGSWPGGVAGMIAKSPKRQGMRVLGR